MRKKTLKRNPSAKISQLGYSCSTSIRPEIFSSHEVASSIFTPASRRSSNSSTGRVPAPVRHGHDHAMDASSLAPVPQMRGHGARGSVRLPISPVQPTTSIPKSWALPQTSHQPLRPFSRTQDIDPLAQKGLPHHPAISRPPAEQQVKVRMTTAASAEPFPGRKTGEN